MLIVPHLRLQVPLMCVGPCTQQQHVAGLMAWQCVELDFTKLDSVVI